MNVRTCVRALCYALAIGLPLFLAVACEDDPTEPGRGEAAAIVPSRSTTFQPVGGSFSIGARVTDAQGTRLVKTISATSTDANVVRVDSTRFVPELGETRVFMASLAFDTVGTDVVLTSEQLSNTVTVISLPASLKITPIADTLSVGEMVPIRVEGLDVAGQSFGDVPFSVTDAGDTTIVKVAAGVVEARGPGTTIVEVTGPGGGLTATSRFTVAVFPAIASLTPASGSPSSDVTITGTDLGFSGIASVVTVGGETIGLVDVVSRTELLVRMPAFAAAGDYDVAVNVAGTASDTATWTQVGIFLSDLTEPANDDPSTAPTIGTPFEFGGSFAAGDVDDLFRFRVTSEVTLQIDLDWDVTKDLDIIVADGAFATAVCTDGATGAKPERSDCHLLPGEYILLLEDFDAVFGDFSPVTYTVTGFIQ